MRPAVCTVTEADGADDVDEDEGLRSPNAFDEEEPSSPVGSGDSRSRPAGLVMARSAAKLQGRLRRRGRCRRSLRIQNTARVRRFGREVSDGVGLIYPGDPELSVRSLSSLELKL